MASRFELFLKYRVVFTPVCPPLQDASKQSSSTALWLGGLIMKASYWSVFGELRLRRQTNEELQIYFQVDEYRLND